MVLQQNKPIPIWGEADPGAKIDIEFSGEKASATTDSKGRWMAKLPSFPANASGQKLLIKSGKEALALEDVLVGEVWIASGQSNMEWSVAASNDSAKAIAAAKHPGIRFFDVNKGVSSTPLRGHMEIPSRFGGWAACSPETVRAFSAVGYFFGRELHQHGKVPVGIISSNWGGTRSEAWTSREALLNDPNALDMMVDWKVQDLWWDENQAEWNKRYEAALEAHKKKVAEIQAHNAKSKDKKPLPRAPKPPRHPHADQRYPSSIYNKMIAPLEPFAIRGAIWYQGESNADRAHQYSSIFPTMIHDWRARWNDEFPFLFVQLANYRSPSEEAGKKSPWAELQWAQLHTLNTVPNTGMAVINEIGDAKDIHPRNKQDVGKRLARWAFSMEPFKHKLTVCGPIYRSMKVDGSKVRISFDHVGGGLAIRGEAKELGGFIIAGDDKVWHWADATIEGKEVVVSAKAVTKPAAVRYAWADNPTKANLMNKEGLPASLFRTDNWQLHTEDFTSPFPELTPRPKR